MAAISKPELPASVKSDISKARSDLASISDRSRSQSSLSREIGAYLVTTDRLTASASAMSITMARLKHENKAVLKSGSASPFKWVKWGVRFDTSAVAAVYKRVNKSRVNRVRMTDLLVPYQQFVDACGQMSLFYNRIASISVPVFCDVVDRSGGVLTVANVVSSSKPIQGLSLKLESTRMRLSNSLHSLSLQVHNIQTHNNVAIAHAKIKSPIPAAIRQVVTPDNQKVAGVNACPVASLVQVCEIVDEIASQVCALRFVERQFLSQLESVADSMVEASGPNAIKSVMSRFNLGDQFVSPIIQLKLSRLVEHASTIMASDTNKARESIDQRVQSVIDQETNTRQSVPFTSSAGLDSWLAHERRLRSIQHSERSVRDLLQVATEQSPDRHHSNMAGRFPDDHFSPPRQIIEVVVEDQDQEASGSGGLAVGHQPFDFTGRTGAASVVSDLLVDDANRSLISNSSDSILPDPADQDNGEEFIDASDGSESRSL